MPRLLPKSNYENKDHGTYEKHRSKNNLSQSPTPRTHLLPLPPSSQIILHAGAFCESCGEICTYVVCDQGVTFFSLTLRDGRA